MNNENHNYQYRRIHIDRFALGGNRGNFSDLDFCHSGIVGVRQTILRFRLHI
jgi:hypothetical protein